MRTLFLYLFLPLGIWCHAQPSLDASRNMIWVLGYGNFPDSEIYHTFFDFRGDSLRIDSMIVPGSLYMSYTNTSICDTSGNLLFFSNGCGVMDSDFQYVSGAEQINEGDYQDYLCSEIGGGRRLDALLILPEASNRFFDLIHLLPVNVPGIGATVDRLLWSRIKTEETGELSTVWKDSTVVLDTLYSGGLASCRHADGKGWWVIAPRNLSNEYYIVKLENGIVQVHKDSVGLATDDFENSTGEATFSPDGTKYARYTIHADLQIFDFDRCTGQFSNPIHVSIVDAADTSYAAGVAFSPSGRYLYVSSTQYIYQFDMQAADIAASKITVAVYDGFYYPIVQSTNRFYQCELGPDGKIYVSCPGGKFTFHVIEHPDSAGLACQVVQHKYILDYPIIGGLPHFPNFRLGPLPEGACPSVAVGEVGEERAGMRVYPNPAQSILYVTSNIANQPYRIYNVLGTIIMEGYLNEQTSILDISRVQDGVYFMTVEGGLRPVKFIVSH